MWRRNQKQWARGASDLNLNWNTIQCYLEQLIWKGFHTKLGPWLMCIACFEVMQVTDRFYIWTHFMGSDFGPVNWNFWFFTYLQDKTGRFFFLGKKKRSTCGSLNLYCTLLHLLDFCTLSQCTFAFCVSFYSQDSLHRSNKDYAGCIFKVKKWLLLVKRHAGVTI